MSSFTKWLVEFIVRAFFVLTVLSIVVFNVFLLRTYSESGRPIQQCASATNSSIPSQNTLRMNFHEMFKGSGFNVRTGTISIIVFTSVALCVSFVVWWAELFLKLRKNEAEKKNPEIIGIVTAADLKANKIITTADTFCLAMIFAVSIFYNQNAFITSTSTESMWSAAGCSTLTSNAIIGGIRVTDARFDVSKTFLWLSTTIPIAFGLGLVALVMEATEYVGRVEGSALAQAGEGIPMLSGSRSRQNSWSSQPGAATTTPRGRSQERGKTRGAGFAFADEQNGINF